MPRFSECQLMIHGDKFLKLVKTGEYRISALAKRFGLTTSAIYDYLAEKGVKWREEG